MAVAVTAAPEGRLSPAHGLERRAVAQPSLRSRVQRGGGERASERTPQAITLRMQDVVRLLQLEEYEQAYRALVQATSDLGKEVG